MEKTEKVQSTNAAAPPVAVPVNWEAVRALAMIVGVREAARRMGISEEAAMKRSQRQGWLASKEAKQANRIAVAQRSGITASPQMSAGALIQAEISQLGSKSRLSLARGVAKAAETVENMQGLDILDRAQDVKSVAQTADLVHGWKDSSPNVKIRLDVLGNVPSGDSAPTLDVEMDVQEIADDAPEAIADVWSDVIPPENQVASDDLDDY